MLTFNPTCGILHLCRHRRTVHSSPRWHLQCSRLSVILCGLLCLPAVASAQQIDRLLDAEQKRQGVVAVDICSDETFLRRLTLDLLGRIPTRTELQDFRRNPDRNALIQSLLDSEEFPQFWSEVWTASLVGYQSEAFDASREPLRLWIRQQLTDGVPYDRMVRELVSAEGDSAFDGPVNFLLRHREEPVIKVSRMFLGIRMDCARCHDHPFARWKRDDFDRFNQFFDSVEYREVSARNVRLVEEPRERDDDDGPRFLSGARPRTSRWRDELALFLTTCKPFARNYANRIWYHFLGRGIVHPPDDFSANDPVAPELLDYLTQYAQDTGFDLRAMIAAICTSQAYQRSSGHSDSDSMDHALFASYVPKPLLPEQMLNSVAVVSGKSLRPSERQERLQRNSESSLDDDFSQTWEYRDNVQTVMQRLTSKPHFRETSTAAIFETVLTRAPTDREQALCRGRKKSQLAFALLHSNEFRFNH